MSFERWNKRDLKGSRWVYWWAGGIHTGARSEDSNGQCLLAIIGVKPHGNFPAEHGQHVRMSHPIESTFATLRHRTTRASNCLSRATFLGMAFKLVESAEQSWRRIQGAERIEQLLKDVLFDDDMPVTESAPVQQPLAV